MSIHTMRWPVCADQEASSSGALAHIYVLVLYKVTTQCWVTRGTQPNIHTYTSHRMASRARPTIYNSYMLFTLLYVMLESILDHGESM